MGGGFQSTEFELLRAETNDWLDCILDDVCVAGSLDDILDDVIVAGSLDGILDGILDDVGVD